MNKGTLILLSISQKNFHKKSGLREGKDIRSFLYHLLQNTAIRVGSNFNISYIYMYGPKIVISW
ncbi:hypothetical protein BN1088_1430609 [Sphingobacterium sp. PM2-P1-29]|nr:hypothetical protein BN1088_1430609 [Sphingobacterium sp. PM2-P1-29]